MKLTAIFLLILTEVTWGFDTATLEMAKVNGVSLSVSATHACGIANNGVTCWNEKGTLEVPNLSHPTQVSAGGRSHTCAIDEGTVKCWGNAGEIPPLSRPKQISAGGYHTCALDDNGVKCWGYDDSGQTKVPPLSHPTQVSAGGTHTCAIDDSGVKCWGWPYDNRLNVPKLLRPTQISVGAHHSCAIDAGGVKCWGDNKNGQGNVPKLSNPTQVSAGTAHSCALDDDGVKCWGNVNFNQSAVPPLSNPYQVSAGFKQTCVVVDDGIKCWGNGAKETNGPEELRDFVSLPVLQNSLKKLALYLYLPKATFVSGLSDIASHIPMDAKATEQTYHQSIMARLVLLELLEPIVSLTSTEYIQRNILPQYNRALSINRKTLKFKSLEEIELVAPTFEAALSATALAIKSSQMSTVSLKLKNELETFLSEIGSLKGRFQNGYDKSQATKLLNLIQENKSLVDELTQNKDTEPFALVLLKIENFLIGK